MRRGSVSRRELGLWQPFDGTGDEDDDAPSTGGDEDRAGAGGYAEARSAPADLTPPDVVPMTEEQHRQAVDVLAAMIGDWWAPRSPGCRRNDHGRLMDDRSGGDTPNTSSA